MSYFEHYICAEGAESNGIEMQVDQANNMQNDFQEFDKSTSPNNYEAAKCGFICPTSSRI